MFKDFPALFVKVLFFIVCIAPMDSWCQSPLETSLSDTAVNNTTPQDHKPLEEQKIGLVLSGGGAKGTAHIGVIRALEENHIPIDYIAGTSMGSVIAGMYAIGMDPDEMEAFAKSPEFGEVVRGIINEDYLIYFVKNDPTASWLSLKIAKDSIWETSLPTNLINPLGLDFMMMEHTAAPTAAANYNFDSLFVPFRCVAADIESKEEVVFRKGQLNEAIRASSTFPFYLRPIRVNGKLLFDGGLYNNFPADIMFDDFYPDIILGSNVSGNVYPPSEDNVLSHIKNMMVSKTNFSVICDNGILIEPKHRGGTFSFNLIESIIDSGYNAALRKIPEIKSSIQRRVNEKALQNKRDQYKAKQIPLIIDQVHVDGLKKPQASYVKKILGRTKSKDEPLSISEVKPMYYRLFQDSRIGSIFPTSKFNKTTNLYDLYLSVKKAKDISLDLGGNLSNKPISGSYIGLQYHYLGYISMSARANAYIGKLYKSAQLKTRLDFPVKQQFYVEPHVTYNQWDYFKSSTDFFDNKTPSYLIQKENYTGVDIGFPVTNKGKLKLGFNYMALKDNYYQLKNFTKLDTADQTTFNGYNLNFLYEKSTLNKKQYANKGQLLRVSGSYNAGEESDMPGSTSPNAQPSENDHNWFQIKLVSDGYYNTVGPVGLGFYFEAMYSNQELFSNYTSSILRAPAFHPTTETKTIFLEALRAHKYAALGQKLLIKIKKNVDIRLEGYMYQPYRLIRNINNEALLDKEFSTLYTLGTGSLIYHSPLGPLCFSVNYYHNTPGISDINTLPITFLFHFGYVIFNKRAIY